MEQKGWRRDRSAKETSGRGVPIHLAISPKAKGRTNGGKKSANYAGKTQGNVGKKEREPRTIPKNRNDKFQIQVREQPKVRRPEKLKAGFPNNGGSGVHAYHLLMAGHFLKDISRIGGAAEGAGEKSRKRSNFLSRKYIQKEKPKKEGGKKNFSSVDSEGNEGEKKGRLGGDFNISD